jgi:hypothetical protein
MVSEHWKVGVRVTGWSQEAVGKGTASDGITGSRMWSRPGPAPAPRYVWRGRRWPAAGAAQPVPGGLRKRKPAGAVRTCPEPPQP